MLNEERNQRLSIKGYDALEGLALNLRSPSNHCAARLFEELEPEIWGKTNNPWAVLQTASKESIVKLLADPTLSALLRDLVKTQQEILSSPSWFETTHPGTSLRRIAYFSMEFMLSEALPIYSGGLGNVAGDQLKAASDLGVPVFAIGLLYAQGYFRQSIDQKGEQKELYPFNAPGQLPVKPLRLPNGEWLRIYLDFPGCSLWLRTWEVQVGRRTLYLLDSNDLCNDPVHRGITSELYGGDVELRLKQELVLGIGGWRLLEALSLTPEVCHMNEGHAAFVVLERAASFMKKTKKPFDVALMATRAGNLFTTHTAVAAGFDRFSSELLEQYLGPYAANVLQIPFEQLLRLGQKNLDDPFHMAYLAIRGSGFINGVSQLHGVVSRHLFCELFPRIPEKEVPIGFVTNGVHMPSWDSKASDELWTSSCGQERWLGNTEGLTQKIRSLPETKICAFRSQSRSDLVSYARKRLTQQLMARGASVEEADRAKRVLDPTVLTLGFARRFAEYKRPDLLLFDEERFLRLLTSKERPVQLILAGKAHPADLGGHALIHRWMQFIDERDMQSSVVFLSDYDMTLTQYLVRGVDVWINTPRRPWEASGTSGMKVLVNGGLNLSELDGWWAEAYSPDVGWALGDGKEHGNDPHWDEQEANALYDLLEKEVIPEFYERDAREIPVRWIGKIRESMARLTPRFSSNRAVREYTEKFYLPAAANFADRAAHQGKRAEEIVQWKTRVEACFDQLRFGQVRKEKGLCEAEVFLGELSPQEIKVELYSENEEILMQHVGTHTNNGHLYRCPFPKDKDASHYTPRIVPNYIGLHMPLECGKILWSN